MAWYTSRGKGSLALLCVLMMAVPIWGVPAAAEKDSLATQGQRIFAENCVACHGADARGQRLTQTKDKIFLRPNPRDLTTIQRRNGGKFPEEKLYRIIDGRDWISAHGPRDMPVWGEEFRKNQGGGLYGDMVTPGLIISLVDYLKSIQQDGGGQR